MRKKIILTIILLFTALSFVSARNHYILVSPLGGRAQGSLGFGMEFSAQELSFFGGTSADNAGASAPQPGRMPRRYVSNRTSAFDTTQGEYGNTIGMHLAIVGAIFPNTMEYTDYYSAPASVGQFYGGASFRQFLFPFMFVYESVGLVSGAPMVIGAYADAGIMFEASFGLVANIGVRADLGYNDDTSGLDLSGSVYAGIGYAF